MVPRSRSLWVRSVALPALLAAAGCGTAPPAAPPPYATPPVRIEVRSFPGGPVAGLPSGDRISRDPAGAPATGEGIPVRIHLSAIERHPAGALEPLASRTLLLAAGRGSLPVLPSPRLLAGARVAGPAGDAAIEEAAGGRLASLGSRAGVLRPGTTWAVAAGDADSGPPLPGGERSWRHVEVLVHLPGPPGSAPVQVAVAKEDLLAPARSGEDVVPGGERDGGSRSAGAAETPEIQREVAIVEGSKEGDGRSCVLIVPFRFGGGAGEAIAAAIEVGGPPLRDDEIAVSPVPPGGPGPAGAGTKKEAPGTIAPEAPVSIEFEAALAGIEFSDRGRRALAFLAARTGAGTCEDAALSGDDPAIDAIVREVSAARSAGIPRDPAGVAWVLERSTYRALAALQAEGKLAEPLRGILAVRAGEAGRDASALRGILDASSGKEDLERRIVEENAIALEDPSPSARARAFDWLRARSRAPEGYDPLAPIKERREAIEKAAAKAAEAEGAAEGGAR
jgi:hypothetical protein